MPWTPRSAAAICRAAEKGAPSVAQLRPALGNVGIETHEYVQMAIHHREPTDRHCENLRKLSQRPIDPSFPVEFPFSQQEGTADTAGHTVVAASQRNVDLLGARDRHGGIST
jgi:hypothetical protein